MILQAPGIDFDVSLGARDPTEFLNQMQANLPSTTAYRISGNEQQLLPQALAQPLGCILPDCHVSLEWPGMNISMEMFPQDDTRRASNSWVLDVDAAPQQVNSSRLDSTHLQELLWSAGHFRKLHSFRFLVATRPRLSHFTGPAFRAWQPVARSGPIRP